MELTDTQRRFVQRIREWEKADRDLARLIDCVVSDWRKNEVACIDEWRLPRDLRGLFRLANQHR